MPYPDVPDFRRLTEQLALYTQLKHERGAAHLGPVLAEVGQALETVVEALKTWPEDVVLARQEPDAYEAIVSLRPPGPRRLWVHFDEALYRDKVEGALLGRFAGCTLGAPVEFWPIERMEALADETDMAFPPRDYWRYVPQPKLLRYGYSPMEAYSRDGMDGVPVDDDIVYTVLGLLIAEAYGPDFTTGDVGQAWLRYLPYACTAEEIALANLRAGRPAHEAAEHDNPYCEWIGASIRADPWGYLAPGWPERAARMAYRDAYLSHRRQGLYGEMFFAASIAAAFAVDDPVEALRIGLSEIPQACALADAVRWALDTAPDIHDYREARAAVEARFEGMHRTHTINNACLTVWGVTLGGTDLTRVIGETVAMGMDNDCTAATAGSLTGALVGRGGLPAHWFARFHNAVHTYLLDQPPFALDDLVARFTAQAARSFAG